MNRGHAGFASASMIVDVPRRTSAWMRRPSRSGVQTFDASTAPNTPPTKSMNAAAPSTMTNGLTVWCPVGRVATLDVAVASLWSFIMSYDMSMSDHVKFADHPGFLLATIGRRAESDWNSFLRVQGMSTAEFTVLAVLEAGARRQGDVAAEAGVDRRNVVATVSRLVAHGLVETWPAEEDARGKVLALTPLGVDRIAALERALAPRRGAFFGALDQAEQEQLTSLLRKLRDGDARATHTRRRT